MSTRNLTAAFKAVTEGPSINLIVLAFFDFASAPVRVWTGYGDLVWGGNTYTGVGDFGSLGNVEEASEIVARGTNFSLSGIPSSLIALCLADAYQGRAAKMWTGALNDSGAIVVDPYMMFSGRMDVIEIQDGADNATITLSAENRLIDLNRSRERRFTDEDQKIDYPADNGLKFIAGLQTKDLLWGQKGNSAGAGYNGNSGQEDYG